MRPPHTRVARLGPVSLLWRPRSVAVGALLVLLCFGIGLLLLASGTVRLPPDQVLAGLTGRAEDPVVNRLIGRIRLPRLLTAMLVGAALGTAGAVFQSLSRNPLGSPDVIGFTTGAASGAVAQIILFNAGPLQTATGAVATGLLTALAVLLLSRVGPGGAGGGYRLVLVGIGMAAVLNALNTLLLVMGDLERAMSAQIWLAGSLTARNWSHVLTASAGVALFLPAILWQARRLAVLEMGDDMARQLGLNTGRMRAVLVLAAVGLTSVATACTGPVAFIALAAPQIARRLTAAPGVPLLSGALVGALLLPLADLISQNLPAGLLLPIGLATGLLGGLYLILVLIWLTPARRM